MDAEQAGRTFIGLAMIVVACFLMFIIFAWEIILPVVGLLYLMKLLR